MVTKTCFKCGNEKPRSEFYAHPKMADGLLGKCKDCVKAYEKTRRASSIPAIRDYENQRAADPKRRELSNRIGRQWRMNNPEKVRAQKLAQAAINSGRITRKPCAKCGAERTEAHHEDYSKPLDVIFLCSGCHKRRHQEIKEGRLVFGAAA